jgi:hypothetical protein
MKLVLLWLGYSATAGVLNLIIDTTDMLYPQMFTPLVCSSISAFSIFTNGLYIGVGLWTVANYYCEEWLLKEERDRATQNVLPLDQ